MLIEVVVRQAEVADAGAIASSHVRSWQVGYADMLPDKVLRSLDSELAGRTLRWQTIIVGAQAEGGFVLVGELDGVLAGWLTGGPCRPQSAGEPELAEVHGCYVDPAQWRRGVGTALMREATRRLDRAGYREAVLWVFEANPRARAFYERHGWRADGARKDYELAGALYPEVRYRLSLSPGPSPGAGPPS